MERPQPRPPFRTSPISISIVINGDLNDLRCFSEEQTKTNIEAFVEQLSEVSTYSMRCFLLLFHTDF